MHGKWWPMRLGSIMGTAPINTVRCTFRAKACPLMFGIAWTRAAYVARMATSPLQGFVLLGFSCMRGVLY